MQSSPNGYRINHQFLSEVQTILNKFEVNPSNFSKSERINYLLNTLILDNEVSSYSMMEELFISESTLAADVDSIRKDLKASDLAIKKEGDVLRLVGSEKAIRSLLSNKIYKEMDNDILTYQKLEKIFPNLNLFIIKNIVLTAIEKANYFTNDFRLMNIILHLCITIDRLSNANTIEIRQEEARNDQDFDDRNMELARQILGLLSNEFGFQFNESEVVYLSLMLSLNIYDEETKSITAANIDRFVSASSLEFVEKMMREIDERYAINLDKGDFKLRFSLHLNSLLSKSKHPKNPMLENIKSSYPIVFEIAVFV